MSTLHHFIPCPQCRRAIPQTLWCRRLSNPMHARLTYRRVCYNVSVSFLTLTAISVVYLQLLQLAIPWWLILWYSLCSTNQGQLPCTSRGTRFITNTWCCPPVPALWLWDWPEMVYWAFTTLLSSIHTCWQPAESRTTPIWCDADGFTPSYTGPCVSSTYWSLSSWTTAISSIIFACSLSHAITRTHDFGNRIKMQVQDWRMWHAANWCTQLPASNLTVRNAAWLTRPASAPTKATTTTPQSLLELVTLLSLLNPLLLYLR